VKVKQTFGVITRNEEIVPGIFQMWLKAPELADGARPGQFLMIRCGEDTVLRRPLSVHRIEDNRLALLYQVKGKGTEWLSHCKKGSKIDVFGLMGNGFNILSSKKNILLVAGGIGIAPLYYLAESVSKMRKNVTLLLGAANAKQLYPPELLTAGIKCASATEDGSIGHKGMVTDLIPDYANWADQIFACGPLPMLRYMAKEKDKLGIGNKPVQISLEMRMGCGVGVCYGCTIHTKNGLKQVCKDGPVFSLDEIIWDDFVRI
jgi:dihydroorotate dehydrogenase electron transfer subunit